MVRGVPGLGNQHLHVTTAACWSSACESYHEFQPHALRFQRWMFVARQHKLGVIHKLHKLHPFVLSFNQPAHHGTLLWTSLINEPFLWSTKHTQFPGHPWNFFPNSGTKVQLASTHLTATAHITALWMLSFTAYAAAFIWSGFEIQLKNNSFKISKFIFGELCKAVLVLPICWNQAEMRRQNASFPSNDNIFNIRFF